MAYVWDFVPSYRLNQEGLEAYLRQFFPSDSDRRRIRSEKDEDHYRVYIPRQLTKDEKDPRSLEKFYHIKPDDDPFGAC
ncbi:hypothetical protein LQW54_003466 [Pestalotiopsis sp. IQ-011]